MILGSLIRDYSIHVLVVEVASYSKEDHQMFWG
jgi:hypothetical protein